jgi:fused signal recognition particle receptor
MLEQLLPIAQLLAIDYRQEILGLTVILFLLVLILRIRKKRPAATIDSEMSLKEPIDELIDDPPVLEPVEPLDEEIQSEYDADDETDLDESLETAKEVEVEEIEGDEYKTEDIETAKAQAPPEVSEPKISFFERLKSGLSKTRQNFSKRFDGILSANRKIDGDVLEEIEEILITSDVGVPTTMELMERISRQSSQIKTADDFKSRLKSEMLSFVDLPQIQTITAKPHVIMMVGVNGVGKTTTIGKLAAQFTAQGKTVLLSASDTFRAAAVEQLQIWADRAGADIVRHRDNADPAAVAYDSIEAAMARDVDIVIVDTAGRLQTKVNLMEQLKKIKRSISKNMPDAPHEVWLVLDATTGQNAVSQAKLFHEGIGITGIVLAKLDGTAKGGIVLSICHTLNIPIRYIGIGETIDDLQVFDAKLFIDALL